MNSELRIRNSFRTPESESRIAMAVVAVMSLGLATPSEWPVTLVDIAAEAGLVAAVRLRRRGRRSGSSSRPTVPAWRSSICDGDGLARCDRAERYPARGGHAREPAVVRRRSADGAAVPQQAGDGTVHGHHAPVRDSTASRGRRRCAPATTTTTAALDLFTTAYGTNALYRNRGDGRFEDVTAPRRPANERHRAGDPDARSSTTIATAGSICSSSNYLRLDLATAAEPARASIASGKASRSIAGRRGCRPTPTCSITRSATVRSATCRRHRGSPR